MGVHSTQGIAFLCTLISAILPCQGEDLPPLLEGPPDVSSSDLTGQLPGARAAVYQNVHVPRLGRNLMIIGSVAGGAAYLAYAAGAGSQGDWRPTVPLIGPWLQLGAAAASVRACQRDCFFPQLGIAVIGTLLAVDGLAQAAGLAILIAGATIQRRTVPMPRVKPILIAPAAGPGLFGLTLQGGF